MADRTKIEWTDATWNLFRGCTRKSKGCQFCYAEPLAGRFSGKGQPFHGFVARVGDEFRWTGRVAVAGDREQPLRWRKPRRIFVNSMSDTFHEEIDWDEIANLYGTMIAAHHLHGHTFQVLTKRPERAWELLNNEEFWDVANSMAGCEIMNRCDPHNRRSDDARATCEDYDAKSPPPGIWLGTSVEDQAAADERIPPLLATPAQIRFLSCEPLLGPITLKPEWLAMIDWVIVGGESGPKARPMHPDWARSIRDQCAAAGVALFFKQWGEWAPDPAGDCCIDLSGRLMTNIEPYGANGDGTTRIQKLGKRRAGRLLDGRTHDAYPGEAA
jgi:protein gp37